MFEMKSSGMEMMLKSMGLGEVLDAAKALADAGTVQKILQFADGLEGLREDVRRQNALLILIAGKLGVPSSDIGRMLSDAIGALDNGRNLEPGSDTGDSGPLRITG